MDDTSAAADQLRSACDRFTGECVGLNEAQWTFAPGPGLWSTAHVAEHLVTSNRNILGRLTTRLLDSRLDGRTAGVLDVEIPYLFYRGDEPPNVATPSGTWTPAFTTDALDVSTRSILQWAAGEQRNLRLYGIAHPVFGILDGVQWLLFAGAHCERHRAQIIGLKRHRDFPS